MGNRSDGVGERSNFRCRSSHSATASLINRISGSPPGEMLDFTLWEGGRTEITWLFSVADVEE